MSDLLTPEECAEMRARCEAATEGPWETTTALHKNACKWRPIPTGNVKLLGPSQRYHGKTHLFGVADGTFIAAARTDLPRALDTIAALRERLKEVDDGR